MHRMKASCMKLNNFQNFIKQFKSFIPITTYQMFFHANSQNRDSIEAKGLRQT